MALNFQNLSILDMISLSKLNMTVQSCQAKKKEDPADLKSEITAYSKLNKFSSIGCSSKFSRNTKSGHITGTGNQMGLEIDNKGKSMVALIDWQISQPYLKKGLFLLSSYEKQPKGNYNSFYATQIEFENSKKKPWMFSYKLLLGQTIRPYGTFRLIFSSKENIMQLVYGRQVNKNFILKLFSRFDVKNDFRLKNVGMYLQLKYNV